MEKLLVVVANTVKSTPKEKQTDEFLFWVDTLNLRQQRIAEFGRLCGFGIATEISIE